MSIAPLIVSWSHYGRIFFLRKRREETGYILSQSTTPRIGEPAHATLQSVRCVSPTARVHERFHFALSSQIGNSPLLAN
jgi:hypothetical protein